LQRQHHRMTTNQDTISRLEKDRICQGLIDGYNAVVNTNPSPSAPSQNRTAISATPPRITSGWQEYVVPLVNMHLGLYHNENGVFIPWRTICNQTQQYLLKSCDQLINPDGSLTSDGDRAVGCIWNGVILTGAGLKFHLPLGSITGILNGLAGPTGCGGTPL